MVDKINLNLGLEPVNTELKPVFSIDNENVVNFDSAFVNNAQFMKDRPRIIKAPGTKIYLNVEPDSLDHVVEKLKALTVNTKSTFKLRSNPSNRLSENVVVYMHNEDSKISTELKEISAANEAWFRESQFSELGIEVSHGMVEAFSAKHGSAVKLLNYATQLKGEGSISDAELDALKCRAFWSPGWLVATAIALAVRNTAGKNPSIIAKEIDDTLDLVGVQKGHPRFAASDNLTNGQPSVAVSDNAVGQVQPPSHKQDNLPANSSVDANANLSQSHRLKKVDNAVSGPSRERTRTGSSIH